MRKERRCIRITSTRTGKLRAKVEYDYYRMAYTQGDGTVQYHTLKGHRFEVTLGGEKWASLDIELQADIYNHAMGYVHHLMDELSRLRRARALEALAQGEAS